jgi:hypothetical protein
MAIWFMHAPSYKSDSLVFRCSFYYLTLVISQQKYPDFWVETGVDVLVLFDFCCHVDIYIYIYCLQYWYDNLPPLLLYKLM